MTTHQIEASGCCGADINVIPDNLNYRDSPPEPIDVCTKCEQPCEALTFDITDCLDCGEECFVAKIDRHTTMLECTACDFQYHIIECNFL